MDRFAALIFYCCLASGHSDVQRSLVRRARDGVEAGAVVEEDRDDVRETAGAGGVERGHVVQVPEVDGETLLDQRLQAAGVVVGNGLEDLLS